MEWRDTKGRRRITGSPPPHASPGGCRFGHLVEAHYRGHTTQSSTLMTRSHAPGVTHTHPRRRPPTAATVPPLAV
eukprot:5543603-Prymnesium_polylepis.1